MSPHTHRGIAIAGGVSGRFACAALASVVLHWGAWQAAAVSPPRSAAAQTVVTMRLVPVAVPVSDSAPAPLRQARPLESAEPAASSSPPRLQPVSVIAPSSRASAARAPARPAATPAASAPTFLEAWEVDAPAEFLVPPLALDELPEQVGEALRAGVALRVDASGRLVDLEVSVLGHAGPASERLRDALAAAFMQVVFMPAQRDGRAVPSVVRWQVGLDPAAAVPTGFQLLN